MRFPSSEDYMTAVQNGDRFENDDLRRMTLVQHPIFRIPLPAAGTSAAVFKAELDGESYALRFFLHADEWSRTRYAELHDVLIAQNLADVVAEPSWIDNGIRVGDRIYPVILMPWIEGSNLNKYVDRLVEFQDVRALRTLAAKWLALIIRLQSAGFAHGDLDHDNVIVDTSGEPRLVGLDCAWAMGFSPLHAPPKFGHSNYQLPTRPWDRWMDTFPGLMVYIALLALSNNPALWRDLYTGENMLFRREDFQPPFHTALWRDHLRRIADTRIIELAGLLQEWCMPGRDANGPLAAHLTPDGVLRRPGTTDTVTREPVTAFTETFRALDPADRAPRDGGGVFISYRRADTSHVAGRLFDRLAQRLGEEKVFMDVDSIEPGLDFTEAIATAVGQCTVLLAVIGPNWEVAADDDGRSRLDRDDDLVRLEIEAALQRGIRVVPVLVDRTTMPQVDKVPASLASLTRRQALSIRHESFRTDVLRIQDALARVL